VGATGYLGRRQYRGADEPFGVQRADAPVLVEIPSGTGTLSIGTRLVAAGIVRDARTFRIAVWRSGRARQLQAGEYRFDRPMSPLEVVDKIARGDIDVVPLTFPEGLTIAEMAQRFQAAGFGSASDFTQAARDASLVRDVDAEAHDLEGYLFPSTYSLPRRTEAATVVRMMVARFNAALTPDLREAARARDVTVRQLVTLASIVEKETGRTDERPLVASVYANRLRIGMPLQCDPTVIYALLRQGRYDGNLRRADLQLDSPYNTYRYPGLPPGPIAAPGEGSLRAAAVPSASDFLYFVSRNDGSHVFARSLPEHSRNVRRFQVEFFRQQRLAARPQ
jgi:UPF0755 protein